MADDLKKTDADESKSDSQKTDEPLLSIHSITSGIPNDEALLPPHVQAIPVPVPPVERIVPAPENKPPAVTLRVDNPPVPTPPAEEKLPTGPFRDDISKILKGIKLPDRREANASGDVITPTPSPLAAELDKRSQQNTEPEPVILSEKIIPAVKTVAPPQTAVPSVATAVREVPLPPAQQQTATKLTTETTHIPLRPLETPAPVSTSKPETTPEPLEEEPESEGANITPLRTLKEDLQNVIRDKKISMVRAVALEADKMRERPQPGTAEIAAHKQRSRRVFAVIFASGILFLLGAAALIGVYTIQNQRSTPVPTIDESSIIFAESAVVLPLANQSSGDVKRTLAQGRGLTNATLGSITRIVPTITTTDDTGPQTRRATTEEFFKAIESHASPDLIRAFGDQFFVGIHTVDKNAPVLVIEVSSFDHAFAGMLAWESTMNQDLEPFFATVPPLKTGDNGLPTYRSFEDMVMRNFDVRALKDDQGNVQMYYSFPTPHILVIAESPYTFTEVLSRLQAGRKL